MDKDICKGWILYYISKHKKTPITSKELDELLERVANKLVTSNILNTVISEQIKELVELEDLEDKEIKCKE